MSRSAAVSLTSLGLMLLVTVPDLGCGGDKPSIEEAMQKAKKAEEEKKAADAEKKAAVKKTPSLADDPSKVEHPWNIDKVKTGLPMGTVIMYDVSGTNAKGKEVTDEFRGEVKGNNENDVAITQTLMSAADTPQATQAASFPWSNLSPFFGVEKAEVEVARRETVQTPAGSFDCIVVELKGFFGAHKTVWLPIGKPGIYAQVVDHGNANEEGDETEMTYVLKSVTTPG